MAMNTEEIMRLKKQYNIRPRKINKFELWLYYKSPKIHKRLESKFRKVNLIMNEFCK